MLHTKQTKVYSVINVKHVLHVQYHDLLRESTLADVFHHDIQVLFVGERMINLRQEWTRSILDQDVSFPEHCVNLVGPLQEIF